MDLTAQTATASTVHHPFGSPSGPGLFRVKGLQLPAYIQNVAHALQRSGSAKDESTAIQMAVGIIRRWSAGDAGHGKRVHPDVQAAAARALAQWEAAKARAHAHSNEGGDAVDLSSDLGEAMAASWLELARAAPGGGGGTKTAAASTKGVATAAQVNIATGATGPRAKSGGGGKKQQPTGGASDSLHPHVAAGSSTGGQFAKKGSGSSSSGSPAKASAAKKAPAKKAAPKKTAAKAPAAKPPAGKAATGKAAPPKTAAKPPAKTPAKVKQPAKTAPKMTGKPVPGGTKKAATRQQALQQRTALMKQAAGDRATAEWINARIASLTASIHSAVKAAAAQKAGAANKKSATAKASTAVKAAATAPAASTTTTTAAGKSTTTSSAASTTASTTTGAAKKTATVTQMRATRKTLRARVVTLKAHAAGLEKQAAAITLSSGDDSAAIELAGPKGYEHGWIKVADAIDQTAGKVATGHDANLGSSVRADRVASFLRIAAKAARTGDHSTALTMLGRAHNDATGGTSRARTPQVMLKGAGSAAGTIDKHIQAVTAARTGKAPAAPRVRKISAAESRRRRAAGELSSDGSGRFLEMAFTEALTERVPPGKAEGGQFHARTSLTRHDTPEEAARAVNAMDERQRAMVRARMLPPPGYSWARADRLAVAT